MGFIQHHEIVGGQKVQQSPGRAAWSTLIDVAGVVFDTGARTDLAQHFKIITGALLKALRLKQPTALLEEF
jgi:hypothetical protein